MLDLIRGIPAYQRLVEELGDRAYLPGLGLPRSARLPVLAALYADLKRPILFITGRMDQAFTMMDELGFWSPSSNRLFFPEPTPMFYELAAYGANTRRDRLQCLTSAARYHLPGVEKPAMPPLIVAPIRAIMTRTLPRRDFLINSKLYKRGQEVKPEDLQRHWVDIGYEPADVVLEPGTFTRRGGLLDVWPAHETGPIRMEFFGNELDTIRRFDPGSQRTIENLEQMFIPPAREVLPKSAILLNLEKVDEFYLPLAHKIPASILDYMPRNALVVVDDLDLLQGTASEVEEQAVRTRMESIREGTLPDDFPIPYISWSEIQDILNGSAWLELGKTSADETSVLADLFQPGNRYAGHLKMLMEDISNVAGRGERVVLISRQVPRLKELWDEQHHPESHLVEFIEGSLSDGWILQAGVGKAIHLLTDSEIFGWERPKPRLKRQAGTQAPEESYADLKPGDWVVHVDYGIGHYEGLVSRTLEGVEREFLCVEYANGDQLYVPVHQADRLSRYIGPSGESPSPTRLGTAEWANAKQKVREAVQEIARELLELYAKRQLAVGYTFSPDNVWQGELEASFPYVETEDQLTAIQAVKADMEHPRPMDRLLCGDVGYGKTEVALRAAFKAVMDSRQVAILVPTTVLAQQHYDTFRQRLAAFPVEVEMLSRFRNPRAQDEIIKKLRKGSVDIIIGTHRLLQADVQFKDLGLLIIDEEQRFGVTHKEHFKRLRTEIDVLTLTATPIPRTLYMALTGVRDISTINTPPEERLPVITHIGPYSPRLVRQAILRELERGGQIFFVHNRVQTIHAMESHLAKLVPEAKVGIGHGQMHEDQLSDVMHSFTRGDIDVLLCTSIIESGLDIPNANTLIVDRGDTFGLAQLYQLRGRVGRGANRAYAYFFRHRKKAPTPEGLERMEVIAENSQLGAGYSIAMRDLEMRGAGELLGTRQSGYIASVGFHLYTRLLAQAVRTMRESMGMKVEKSSISLNLRDGQIPVSVDLPLKLGIPMDYVPEQSLRLRLYRRLANIDNETDLDSLVEEFTDRFGPMPEPLQNLILQLRVKVKAEAAGLSAVIAENDQIVLRFPPIPEGGLPRNLPELGFSSRAGKNSYWLAMGKDGKDWQERLFQLLSAIINL